jgi:hypothetical protein
MENKGAMKLRDRKPYFRAQPQGNLAIRVVRQTGEPL